jgi:hypothetical protein
MNLIYEQQVAFAEVGDDGGEISGSLYGWA